MKFAFALIAGVAALEQDPCAGCDDVVAQAHQQCARDFGDACQEMNSKGTITSGQGTKKDVSCCMKKEKHIRCMTCKSQDCEFATCDVNKKYYSTYKGAAIPADAGSRAHKKAQQAAGWGL